MASHNLIHMGVFRSSAGPHDVFVGRAPGRMDVMGGIPDYSGSLVLQRPLAEACMVCSVSKRWTTFEFAMLHICSLP